MPRFFLMPNGKNGDVLPIEAILSTRLRVAAMRPGQAARGLTHLDLPYAGSRMRERAVGVQFCWLKCTQSDAPS